MSEPLLHITPKGLYCPTGDFYIDPPEPVDRAVITHAHADHARPGCGSYLSTAASGPILKHRLGDGINLRTLEYGETLSLSGLHISLHPAGHILGSAQIRMELDGQVWVVSGDYKTEADRTCASFEPIECHTFVTESTFGLPIFRWQAQGVILEDINAWWRNNRDLGKTSLLFVYALGKAQRVLSGLDPSIGPILTHGAVEHINACYRREGIHLPETRWVGDIDASDDLDGAIVLAPPSADNGSWTRKFKHLSRAFVSGWMQIRGHRRRRAIDRGFVLSDHCDWHQLNSAIKKTSADAIWVQHGYSAELARWLQESGRDARDIGPRPASVISPGPAKENESLNRGIE